MKEFKTIKENIRIEIVEKKSKFIAGIYYIENRQEAEVILNDVKKKYYDARHHCYAYRIIEKENIIDRCSDDGEPSGTAGAPMLNLLQKNDLCNVLVIVTRYFGGILLGTGGLVRAYSEATSKVIEESKYIYFIKGYEVEISLEYKDLENFKYYCKINNIKIIDVEYLDNIKLIIEITKEENKRIIENLSNNKFKILKSEILKEKNIQKSVDI